MVPCTPDFILWMSCQRIGELMPRGTPRQVRGGWGGGGTQRFLGVNDLAGNTIITLLWCGIPSWGVHVTTQL